MKEFNLEKFNETRWTFVVIKNNKITYRSKKEGLKPLLFCLKEKKDLLRNSTVYDKIVGRAAACLMIYGKVKSVITPVISRSALRELEKYQIKINYQKTTGKIMNQGGDDICPMEKLSKNKNPDEFARIMLKT
ncbi:MAG TPA: DUF1893 domain-containing protein [Patescibacteria group bacterium]|nr:DUF1893 domain-containing protein [Patescibacteria group bacterium]